MNLHNMLHTSGRVLNQLWHDPRTLALLFVVPSMLLAIMRSVFEGSPSVFTMIAPMLLGIFPMVMMFLITSIVTLRERKSGTLDRLMTTPLSKFEFVFGYALAFLALAFCQAVITTFVMLGPLGVTVSGGFVATIVAAIASGFLGTSLGLFLSAFATSEFQAIQFMPAFIFPQLLTCGLFVPRALMAEPLQVFADVMPLTYSVDAMLQVTRNTTWTSDLTKDLIIVVCFGFAALILGSLTIRRVEE